MSHVYKLIFSLTLTIGTLITISSNSWLGVWMGLEINLLSFIPLMNNSASKNKSSEAALKYFITQALASMILLMAMMINSFISTFPWNFQIETVTSMCMTTALLLKTGAAPFHFWFPEVMEGLSWMSALTLLTWQKIAPMATLMYIHANENLLTISLLCSTVVGGLMGLNQTSMRKILSYSSINHLGWMIAAMIFTEILWKWYFIIYSAMNLMIIWILNKINISNISQLLAVGSIHPQMKIFLISNFFSMGGIPPFIGFLPKWLTIQALVTNQMYLVACLLIVITLVTLYFYMRITMPSFNLSSSSLILSTSLTSTLSTKSIFILNSALMGSLLLATLALNWI
uniref:NADH-ubiquinone oxidoreductase chain 2 n=1 Tax=Agrilus ornatus TaxID=2951065 RepID=A0A8X8M116_9COLE|nr:NADH dehydrogenase subunit 2 [Agrilus ornatus]URW97755.1 NADH dehydrogenase subunit 2 [Agrilus ornatus]